MNIWISNITIFEGRHVLYPLLWVSVVSDFKGCNLFLGTWKFRHWHSRSNIGYRCIHGFKKDSNILKVQIQEPMLPMLPFFFEVSRIFITLQNFQKSRIEWFFSTILCFLVVLPSGGCLKYLLLGLVWCLRGQIVAGDGCLWKRVEPLPWKSQDH